MPDTHYGTCLVVLDMAAARRRWFLAAALGGFVRRQPRGSATATAFAKSQSNHVENNESVYAFLFKCVPEFKVLLERLAGGESGKSFARVFLAADEEGAFIHEDEITEIDLPRKIHLDRAFVSGDGPMVLRVGIRSVSAWSMGNSPNLPDREDVTG